MSFGAVRKLAVIVFAVNLFALSLPATARAADFNLTASPLPIDLSVKPGGAVSTPLKVQNTGSQTVRVKVTLMKFKANGTSGKPEILDLTPLDTYIDWVSFSETSFQAEPNVWHTITMTIRAPKEAAFGYYYAVVFSESDTNQTLTSSQHNIVHGAVSSLVLLDVNAPGEKRTLTVKSYVSARKIYEFLPADFTVVVHNSGNVHAVPSGDIFISRDKKNDIAHMAINASGGNILPGTDRLFTASWSDGFPSYQTKRVNGQILSDKSGKPMRVLSWDGLNLSKLRIGHYYAHLLLTYNDGTRDIPVEGDLSFWVIPWRLIIFAILIPTVPALSVYLFMRWRNKRKYRKRS
ncbi:MAG TPA: hypothetical protein VLG13_03640 [Patescibacteria group bacterium]|nr:hypothetical protein [Patescibacteria group bacterium]